jgi:hypothetical protein
MFRCGLIEAQPAGSYRYDEEPARSIGTFAQRPRERTVLNRAMLAGREVHNDQPISSFMISFVPA